jgi:acyl phosphate:glycerol-3-phosphate acyltransferase
VVAYLSRYSSLAALVAALAAPLYQLLLWDGGTPTIPITVMSLLLVWRHAGNIQKLLAGTESRLGQKAGAGHTTAATRPHSHSKRGAK